MLPAKAGLFCPQTFYRKSDRPNYVAFIGPGCPYWVNFPSMSDASQSSTTMLQRPSGFKEGSVKKSSNIVISNHIMANPPMNGAESLVSTLPGALPSQSRQTGHEASQGLESLSNLFWPADPPKTPLQNELLWCSPESISSKPFLRFALSMMDRKQVSVTTQKAHRREDRTWNLFAILIGLT